MINPLNVAAVVPETCHALPTSGTCSGSVRQGSKEGAAILGRVWGAEGEHGRHSDDRFLQRCYSRFGDAG